MAMSPYPMVCQTPDCGRAAQFKVAARWSDGVTDELKTYALCCPACLRYEFAQAILKRAACRLSPGETLDPPCVFRLSRGSRDPDLVRVPELENLLGPG